MSKKLSLPQKLYEFPYEDRWAELRLRQLLERLLPGLPSRTYVLMVNNNLVTTGGEPLTDLDTILEPGQDLAVDLRHGLRGEGTPKRKSLAERVRVLHDDDDLVVVSKAAGVLVQPTQDEQGGQPVVEIVKHYWRAKKQPVINPVVVQRLDKLTSGVMVLGKTVDAGRILQKQAAGRTMERRYFALVQGGPSSDTGTWHNVLGIGADGVRRVVGPMPEAGKVALKGEEREAITHFRVKQRKNGVSLLELRLETGRQHQIRIHCAAAGCPVLGDPVYWKIVPAARDPKERPSGKKKSVAKRKNTHRMMLHAVRLKFQHPNKASRWLTFRDELPEDFLAVCREYGIEPE
ncbi:MAG: RluA family pseudouridine synthase [Sumerlaeia bacterium]